MFWLARKCGFLQCLTVTVTSDRKQGLSISVTVKKKWVDKVFWLAWVTASATQFFEEIPISSFHFTKNRFDSLSSEIHGYAKHYPVNKRTLQHCWYFFCLVTGVLLWESYSARHQPNISWSWLLQRCWWSGLIASCHQGLCCLWYWSWILPRTEFCSCNATSTCTYLISSSMLPTLWFVRRQVEKKENKN